MFQHNRHGLVVEWIGLPAAALCAKACGKRATSALVGAIENGLVSLRQAEKAVQDPAQSALVKQGLRELSQFHANAMLGWETANALRQG